jgi:hypothetical protein
MNFANLRSVRQVARLNTAFSEASLRWLIHRPPAGFDDCVVRIGGRVLIDFPRFEEWLEAQRASNNPAR